MPLYVVQMFYSTLKDAAPLVAEAKRNVANLSANDFVLMGFAEHSNAIAFASKEPQANIGAQLGRIRGENFSLVVFEVASFVGVTMSKQVGEWLDRHRPGAPR
jgi:ABC-type cobalamin/Fe3+-siderophores transport system ATPase subunit